MKRISTFFYGIGQGLKNIRRNRMFSLASIATMAACLFLFGVFYFVLANFRNILKDAETKVGITVFFEPNVTEEEIFVIRDDIKLRAEVGNIDYISPEQAWEDYKTNNLSPELVETFGTDNPLEHSASLTVYLNDVSMQDSLTRHIKNIPGVRKVNDKQEISDSFVSVNKVITIVGIIIVAVLLGVAIFLISITISTGVSVRKEEISIMKLIGATDFFIRIPYVVEGIIIGLIGTAIPLVIIHFSYEKIIHAIMEKFPSLFSETSFLSGPEIMKVLLPVSILIGIGIGFLGSMSTLGRQLKKIEV